MNVTTDPDLSPEERETVIQWADDEDRLHIFTEMAAIGRWLHKHPDAEVTSTREKDGQIVATVARLTVGALKLSGHPRKSTTPSSVTGTLPDGDSDE